jgi:hypothetical protein
VWGQVAWRSHVAVVVVLVVVGGMQVAVDAHMSSLGTRISISSGLQLALVVVVGL